MQRIIYLLVLLSISILNINSQWIQQNSPTSIDLKKVRFVNQNTGFMINDYWNHVQVVYKTTNSGVSWDSTIIGDVVNGMYFLNAATGWLTGRTSGDPGTGKVWKTTDGGSSWNSVLLADSLNGYSVFFTDANTGILTANEHSLRPKVLRSTNGGSSWNEITGIMTDCRRIFNVFFVNNNAGWFTVEKRQGNDTRNIIFKTTNSGLNWISYDFPGFFGGHVANLKNIQFINENTGYVSGNVDVWYNGGVPFPKFFTTTNGGVNWSDLEVPDIPPYMHYINGMHFINIDTGWIAGNRGNFLVTTNKGLNWSLQSTGLPTNVTLYDLNYSEGTLWSVARSGKILKTTNGGFSSAFSVTGTVRYSDNGLPVSRGFVKAFKHSETGGDLVMLDSAGIQSNGTYTFINLPIDTVDLMAFDDDEVSYSPSFVPTYYPSTIFWEDAEQIITNTNHTNININVFRITNDLQSNISVLGGVFLNSDNTILSGIEDAVLYARVGNIYRAYDITPSNGNYEIEKMPPGQYEIICSRMGYESKSRFVTVVSNNLTEINFYYGDLTAVNPEEEVPLAFSLSQNFPNPFNPVTKIKFALPKASFVSLVISDILGREIVSLAKEELKAGYYNVEWNAGNYPSGVYFYSLRTVNFTETKKMILIK